MTAGLHSRLPSADNTGMSHDQASKPSSPSNAADSVFKAPAFRVLVAFGVLGAFALAASTFGPRFSSASPGSGGNSAAVNVPRPWEKTGFAGSEDPFAPSDSVRPVHSATTAPLTDRFGRPLLGSLKGKDYTVWIYSSRTAPVYTVVSGDGRILQEGLEVDEVYRAFPDLPIDSMRLDPAEGSTKLMHVEPRE